MNESCRIFVLLKILKEFVCLLSNQKLIGLENGHTCIHRWTGMEVEAHLASFFCC